VTGATGSDNGQEITLRWRRDFDRVRRRSEDVTDDPSAPSAPDN